MSKEAAKALQEAMQQRRERKLAAIDEMKGWLEEWLLTLSDEQLGYLHRHFELITNLEGRMGR